MNAPVASPAINSTAAKGRIVCYMCGGTGVNIAKVLAEQFKKLDMAPAAQVDVVLIDTSESNLASNQNPNTFLLKGKDGSGGIRGENYTDISRAAPGILEKNRPGDLNIVVSSLSGGSGSVFAPVLAAALLEQNHIVVAVGVASQGSVNEINNTIKTIQSYESISRKAGKPIVMSIQKNSDSDTFQKINEAVASTILMLGVLFSRKNSGLDSADLRNWANYSRVSKAPIKAVTLHIANGEDAHADLGEEIQPITTVSLAREGTPAALNWVPDYHRVGYVSADSYKTGFEKPMHFTILDGEIAALYTSLDRLMQELERKAAARTYAPSALTGKEVVQDDGMVL